MKAEQAGEVRVIVRLRAPFAPGVYQDKAGGRSQRDRISLVQDAVVGRLQSTGPVDVYRYANLPLLAMRVDARQVEALASDPDVQSIQEDIPSPPSLASSIPLIGADAAWAAGYTGAGWAVAILDTGVDSTHPFLAGKVIAEACFSDFYGTDLSLCPNGQQEQVGAGAGTNCPTSIEGCSHGTHVAGIAAGKGTQFSGVAKDAKVVAVQIFTEFTSLCSGFGLPSPCALSYTADQIRALDWVFNTTSGMNIASVNMSLGGGQYTAACDSDSRKPAIDNLRSVGTATVIAAGNYGYRGALTAPACISTAISVGASTDSDSYGGPDSVASYSDVAPFMDLFAPGSTITSSVPGGGFATWDGTSMAAPHVTGAWALMRSKAPQASVDDILAVLTSTGVMVTDTRSGGSVSKPRIQVDAALVVLPPEQVPTPHLIFLPLIIQAEQPASVGMSP